MMVLSLSKIRPIFLSACVAMVVSCPAMGNQNAAQVLTPIILEPLLDNYISINQTGFEGYADEHEYTHSSWGNAGFDAAWVNGFDQGRAYIDTSQSYFGNASLRIEYPVGGVGPEESGAQAPLRFTGEEEVYVSYWLRFSDNFDWGGSSEGGKLPGLGSGDNCSGGTTCSGTNGFTARFMWRSDGRVVLYLYHMDKKTIYGDDFQLSSPDGSNVHFMRSAWYNVVQRVRINSGTNNDGEIQVWINGREALNLSGLRFVNDSSLIDNLYFSTFHGGSGDEFAPGNTSYIWFDDLKIYATSD